MSNINPIWQKVNFHATRELEKSLRYLSKLYLDERLSVVFNEVPHPLTFLYYSRLINNYNNSEVEKFLNSLSLKRSPSPTIVPYGSEIYSEREWSDLIESFSSEKSFPKSLLQPPQSTILRSTPILTECLGTLHYASPSYSLLIDIMVGDVVIAKSGTRSEFGGATQFFFWGGVIISSRLLASKIAFLEQLLHESLHMALFALCGTYGALCTNPDEYTYQSAYRSDLRPMHGLIHAYFVAANLANCFKDLVSYHSFGSEKFKGFLETALEASELLYKEISESANLTSFGESILQVPEINNPDFLK